MVILLFAFGLSIGTEDIADVDMTVHVLRQALEAVAVNDPLYNRRNLVSIKFQSRKALVQFFRVDGPGKINVWFKRNPDDGDWKVSQIQMSAMKPQPKHKLNVTKIIAFALPEIHLDKGILNKPFQFEGGINRYGNIVCVLDQPPFEAWDDRLLVISPKGHVFNPSTPLAG